VSEIRRFSSRRHRLDHAFLNEKLKGARSYHRIAGYFRSSIFELVGEEIAAIPKVRVVCNSELDAADVLISKHARETALKERWNKAPAQVEALLHRERYRKLHELLTSERVEIRVVPKDRVFGHGKAGVIEAADGSKTCFLGSINETKSAFAQNFEILWEDPSPKAVAWVEEEFARSGRTPIRYPMPSSKRSAASRSASRYASPTRSPKRCRPPRSRRARYTEAASSFSRGSDRSSRCSCSTGRHMAGRVSCLRTRWA
jgi:hypothetical protein